MSRQVTIKDIAKKLGIAASTVSRALQDKPNISEATKARVLALASELKYEPNKIAVSLKNSSTKTIGVIIPEIVHFFFSTVISGIEEVAYANGYTVLFCQSNESYDKEVKDTLALLAQRVDGLLVSHSRETRDFKYFMDVRSKQIPVVFFDRVPCKLPFSRVTIDDFKAGQQATQHLIEQGCRRIAHLAGSLHLQICQDRKEGYLAALREASIPIAPELVVDCNLGSESEGYTAVQKLLQSAQLPDGIFANNDRIAIGAMRAIKQAGFRIPQDVAIIGFSGWQFCELTEPQLSTIAQPGREMGKVAMAMLLEQFEKTSFYQPKHVVLQTRLIARSSSNRQTALERISIR